MHWTHLHLALNHVPVIGLFFVWILFVVGMIRRNEEVRRISLFGFVFLAALTLWVKYTGDWSNDSLKGVAWLDVELVSRHEQAADRATTGCFVLGVLASANLLLVNKMKATIAWINGLILVTGLVSFLLLVLAANLGGDIRHSEIRDVRFPGKSAPALPK